MIKFDYCAFYYFYNFYYNYGLFPILTHFSHLDSFIMAEENETNNVSEKENEGGNHDLNNENDVELIDLSNDGRFAIFFLLLFIGYY